jgi:Cdc6-like AAA superfamily ATPase
MFLDYFLIPLLAGITLIFLFFAFKTALEQTRITMDKENQAKSKKENAGLTPEERKKFLQESGFEDNQAPFIVGQPVRYGNFFGREDIIQSLFNLWKSFPMQNAAIYGEEQIGKTSLLRYLKDVVDNPNDSRFREGQKTDWLSKHEKYCFIYVDFQDVEYHTPKRFLEYILQNMRLEKTDKLDLSLSEESPLLDFSRIIKGHLIKPTVILMDEIEAILERHSDKFSHDFWEGLRAIVTTKLEPQCLSFVLSSNQHPTELNKKIPNQGTGSSFFNIFNYPIELKAFTKQEAKELIASSPKQFSDDDIQFILDKSELKPYLLQLLCQMYFSDNSDWRNIDISNYE